jgi:site-specific recombinase XerD
MTTTNPLSDESTVRTVNEVLDAFLEERKISKATSTYYNNKGHLDHFRNWCAGQSLENMRDLSPHQMLQYKLVLKGDDEKNDTTVGNYFSTIRTFLKWANKYDYCDENLPTAMESDEFTKEQKARSRMIPFDQASRVLDYLAKFKYATAHHGMVAILWHTGCRRRALCGLDVGDWKPIKEREHGRYGLLDFNHRPETDTPLKNDEGGEREVIVGEEYGAVIQDYLDTRREDRTDRHGREPLFTSGEGRYQPNSIQPLVNAMTRPCEIGDECPVDRDPDECEAAYFDYAAQCPDSYSPHPFRRAAITYHLEEKNWTYEGASGRFDVSVEVLKKHYDQSSKAGRRKTRAAMFYGGD